MKEEGKTCENCRAFEALFGEGETPSGMGLCKRIPPSPIPFAVVNPTSMVQYGKEVGFSVQWPVVAGNDYCMEWMPDIVRENAITE